MTRTPSSGSTLCKDNDEHASTRLLAAPSDNEVPFVYTSLSGIMIAMAKTPKEEKRRELSTAEQQRLAAFEKMAADFRSAGYAQSALTTSIVRANVFALLFGLPFIVVFGALFFAVNASSPMPDIGPLSFLLFMLTYILLVVVHELIHGATWAVFAKNRFADIEFGFIKEQLTPYCTCKTPLGKWPYVIGAAMPCIVLGIIPSAVGIVVGSSAWLSMGLLMIISAGGDAMIIWMVLRYKPKADELVFVDHPTELGGVVFER